MNMSDLYDKSETKMWVVMCPHCNRYQAKKIVNWGRSSTHCKCVYCGKRFKMVNKVKVFQYEATAYVANLNMGDKQMVGFGTFTLKNKGDEINGKER